MTGRGARPLRLGHIVYSNCYPVHARLLETPPPWLEIVAGTPAELNAGLAEGRVDVAPASSIEFARHPDRYRILPGLSISSRGPVRTIAFAAARPWTELDGATVALPTASATSVWLLRILLEERVGVRPTYVWFRQESEDPRALGADAALFIGDLALAARRAGWPHLYDLGAEWDRWTGLPFVFALWQTPLGDDRADELEALRRALLDARAWAFAQLESLARRAAPRFGWAPEELAAYWRSLDYGLDPELLAGLQAFYRRAVALGALETVPPFRFAR
jgi:chorismate dehydratase